MFGKINWGQNPYVSMMRTAWTYAKDERRQYARIYTMFSISNLFDAVNPIIWGWFINELQRKGSAILESTWKYALAYLVLWLLDWIFHGMARVQERQLAFNLSQNFLQELYHKALHLPTRWHQDNHSGSTINRMKKAYDALKEFFENGFMYFHTIMKFMFSLAAMIYFAPVFGILAVVMGIFILWVINRFDRPFIAAHRETNEREHVVASTLFDSLSNIITVITLRLEGRMEKGLLKKIREVFPPFKRKVIVNEWKWFTVDFFISVIYVSILVGYVYQNYVPGEMFLIGGLVTLMSYVQRFTSVFHNFAWQYNQIVQYNTDVQTAFNIAEAYEQQHLPENTFELRPGWKKMEIHQLNFSHQSDEQEEGNVRGLIDLNIAFQKGQKIALVGESGSGKSTLLALLRGLYEPQKGVRLNVDQQAYEDLSIISNHVTLFPQEPEIFESTIAYNINLGLPSEQV
jgi:ATP-binding cassette subfamily B protein